LTQITSRLLTEDYIYVGPTIELAKLHRHKRAQMSAAETVRRGESNGTESVHFIE